METSAGRREHIAIQVDGAMHQALEMCRGRLVFIFSLILLCFGAISFRLVDLALDGLREESRHLATVTSQDDLHPPRREIVDRNGELLAMNLNTVSLFANPKIILDVEETAEGLHRIFPDLDKAELLEDLQKERSFIWVKRNIHPREQDAVMELGQPGLNFLEEEKRLYPYGEQVAHVLGTVGTDGYGLAGIEKQFEKTLAPQYVTPDAEQPLELALDARLQAILFDELKATYEKHSAEGAAAILMDAHNGEVLSMISLPAFDPNQPSEMQNKEAFNYATLGVYEMGSTFKTFAIAQALDQNLIHLDNEYDATKPIYIARHRIADFHPENRVLNVPEIFLHSSNIGTARIADEIGPEAQQQFYRHLGLFDQMDFELPELGTPLLPERWGRLVTMTASFGHGIAVSPLHVVRAYAAMVNGGKLVEPTLFKREKVPEFKQVIRAQTSETMRRLLRLVVAEGTGESAEAPGYYLGGKTGTAEKAGIGQYDRKRLISSFAGAFPMYDPQYVLFIMFDEPKGIKETWGYATAGWTAAPTAKRVVERIGPLLGVKPVDPKDETINKGLYVEFERHDKELAAQ